MELNRTECWALDGIADRWAQTEDVRKNLMSEQAAVLREIEARFGLPVGAFDKTHAIHKGRIVEKLAATEPAEVATEAA